MSGPNLMGSGLFGGFMDPRMRKDMQQRRKMMPFSAVNPQKAPGVPLPGAGGNPALQVRPTSTTSPRGSIFSRFGNGF